MRDLAKPRTSSAMPAMSAMTVSSNGPKKRSGMTTYNAAPMSTIDWILEIEDLFMVLPPNDLMFPSCYSL